MEQNPLGDRVLAVLLESEWLPIEALVVCFRVCRAWKEELGGGGSLPHRTFDPQLATLCARLGGCTATRAASLARRLSRRLSLSGAVPLLGRKDQMRRFLEKLPSYLGRGRQDRVHASQIMRLGTFEPIGGHVSTLAAGMKWCWEWEEKEGLELLPEWEVGQRGGYYRGIGGSYGDSPPLLCIAVHKQVAASGGTDRVVRLWDVSRDAPVLTAELDPHAGSIVCLAFSNAGDLLCSGSDDEAVKVWQVSDRAASLRWTLRGHGPVFCLAVSPDGASIACGSGRMDVSMWDAVSGVCVGVLRGHTPLNPECACKEALAPHPEQPYDLWGFEPLPQCPARGHSRYVFSVAFDPSGALLASGSWDCTVLLWSTARRRVERALVGHTGFVFSVAFSPSGASLASASLDQTVRLWDAATGAARAVLRGGEGEVVRALAFSPDGRWLACGSMPHSITLYGLAGGGAPARGDTLWGHQDGVTGVCFFDGGARMLSSSWDGSLRVWDTHPAGPCGDQPAEAGPGPTGGRGALAGGAPS